MACSRKTNTTTQHPIKAIKLRVRAFPLHAVALPSGSVKRAFKSSSMREEAAEDGGAKTRLNHREGVTVHIPRTRGCLQAGWRLAPMDEQGEKPQR